MGFLGFVVSQLTSIFPPSVHFCEFSCGPHLCPKSAAGQQAALCSSSAPQHHHFVVVFLPPQWSPGHDPCIFHPPSYQGPCFDPWFDHIPAGTHLKSPPKSVPYFSLIAIFQVLNISLLLILWELLVSFCLNMLT